MVDVVDVMDGQDALGRNVTKGGDLITGPSLERLGRAAENYLGEEAKGHELLDSVLGGLGLGEGRREGGRGGG